MECSLAPRMGGGPPGHGTELPTVRGELAFDIRDHRTPVQL